MFVSGEETVKPDKGIGDINTIVSTLSKQGTIQFYGQKVF